MEKVAVRSLSYNELKDEITELRGQLEEVNDELEDLERQQEDLQDRENSITNKIGALEKQIKVNGSNFLPFSLKMEGYTLVTVKTVEKGSQLALIEGVYNSVNTITVLENRQGEVVKEWPGVASLADLFEYAIEIEKKELL
jgi:TolA-binding protein